MYKGRKFQSWRQVGHALQATRIHQARGVDELAIFDISATPETREPNYRMIEELSDKCFMPMTVGGGVRSVEHVRGLLNAGADKVAICTALLENAELMNDLRDFGRQAVVGVIETVNGRVSCRNGSKRIDFDPVDVAKYYAKGVGEIVLNSADRDGTMTGYDLETINLVSSAVDIPLVALGGAGTYEHMREAIQAGASAVAAGAMFQFTDATPKGAARYLSEHGIETRI